MATQAVLTQLCQMYADQTGVQWQIESVGGVTAAERVRAGESFDAVLLASDAIGRLIATGHVLPGSQTDWVDSPVALAVAQGTPVPEIGSEAALRQAVLAAPQLSYSTGPSGVYLETLFQRWGILDSIRSRIVVPPPGTPVGTLVAQGRATLGFQQLSELMALPGLTVVGCLPPEVAYLTTFSAGLPATLRDDPSRQAAARAFLSFLASPATLVTKQRHGMDWPQ